MDYKKLLYGISVLLVLSLAINVWFFYDKFAKNTATEIPEIPTNAESSYSCSVRQGFNFEKDAQILVGYVNELKIGDRELAADLHVTDPEDVSGTLKVVGVVSNIRWQGGYADPVHFSSQVSTDNKNTLATLVHKELSNTEVEFEFTVYDYDPRQKKYYKAFHTDGTKLKGLILKSGGELAMNIDMEQSMEVVSPKNYAFTLGVMPQEEEQQIHLAFSVSDTFVKPWGVTVGGGGRMTTVPTTSVSATTSLPQCSNCPCRCN